MPETADAQPEYDPSGLCTRIEDGYAVSNGPTWSLDGGTMFFNDTVASRTLAFDFDRAEGTLVEPARVETLGP